MTKTKKVTSRRQASQTTKARDTVEDIEESARLNDMPCPHPTAEMAAVNRDMNRSLGSSSASSPNPASARDNRLLDRNVAKGVPAVALPVSHTVDVPSRKRVREHRRVRKLTSNRNGRAEGRGKGGEGGVVGKVPSDFVLTAGEQTDKERQLQDVLAKTVLPQKKTFANAFHACRG